MMASSCEPIFKVTIGIFGGKEEREGEKEALEGGRAAKVRRNRDFRVWKQRGREGGRELASPDCVAPPSSYAEGERGNFISASSSSRGRHL